MQRTAEDLYRPAAARALTLGLGAGGLLLAVAGPYHYLESGFDAAVLAAWVGAIVLLYMAVRRSDPAPATGVDRVEPRDWSGALALLLLFAPLYLVATFQLPVQVSTDEIVIGLEADWSSGQGTWDIFALSGYFDFPRMQFILFGALGRLAGGVDLHNMRLIHALLGLTTVPLTFLLLRSLCSPWHSVAGAILLGTNHSLVAISRMAMRNDTALLLELAALAVLLRGAQRGSGASLYWGGALAGLSFYFYEPGRLTILIWLAMALVLRLRRRDGARPLTRRLIGASLVGFGAVVAPLAAVTLQAGLRPESFQYSREQLLFTPEGQELQQEWVGARTRVEGVRINILQGLIAFNSRLHDHGYIYYNPGYGFIDPLSGLLLWVGLGTSMLARRRRMQGALLMAPGLLIPWLVFSFATTKAPNYTRMLITLPFVAYFVTRGIDYLVERSGEFLEARGWRGRRVPPAKLLGGLLVGAIAALNLYAYGDYLVRGIRHGEEVGNTGRYIDARRDQPGYAFYIATDQQHPYNPDNYPIAPWRWVEWLEYFAGENQIVRAVLPPVVTRLDAQPPFTIFMNADLWAQTAESLARQHPTLKLHAILSDRSLVAIEVLGSEEDG